MIRFNATYLFSTEPNYSFFFQRITSFQGKILIGLNAISRRLSIADRHFVSDSRKKRRRKIQRKCRNLLKSLVWLCSYQSVAWRTSMIFTAWGASVSCLNNLGDRNKRIKNKHNLFLGRYLILMRWITIKSVKKSPN